MKRIRMGILAGACLMTLTFNANAVMSRPVLEDYDGDGYADPAVYESESGYWYIYLSSSGAVQVWKFGMNSMRPAPGDYDGDGCADLAVYERETGYWYIYLRASGVMHVMKFGAFDMWPVPADYDGDGCTDLAVYQHATGDWYIYQIARNTVLNIPFGNYEYRPVPADYDGDGCADLALFHRASANWYIVSWSNWTVRTVHFGLYTSRPVPADYDGDGCTDIAVFQRDGGYWYVYSSAANTLLIYRLGSAATRPAPADYDGDGRADLAVYDRSTGYWQMCLTASAVTQSFKFGQSSMAVLPSYENGATEGVVFLAFGDSITYGGGSSSDGPDTGYPILLEKKIEPAFGGCFVSINSGNPGETTEEGLERFEAVLNGSQPDVLLLMEGTNDHFYDTPFDDIEVNLREMVRSALSRGMGVIIGTIPPVISNEYRERSGQQARIAAFNPRIHAIAADFGIPVAAVYESITAVPGWEQNLMEQRSANHPNDAGYLVVRDAFYSAMADSIDNGWLY